MPDRHRPAGGIRTAAAGVALAWALSGPNTCAEQGLASWYGKSFHGKLAASGETYDAGALTAAHRTLPFGTNVRIRRVEGGDSVVVRINDRGPYDGDRLIDVSEAAARRLGMTDSGVVKVALEVLLPASGAAFAVQAVPSATPTTPGDCARRSTPSSVRLACHASKGARVIVRSGRRSA